MSDTVARTATIRRRFVVLWMLTVVVPGLLLMISRSILLGSGPSAFGYYLAALAPAPVWLLIGFLQFRLLRPDLRSSLWWLLATFTGGILGMFAGGAVLVSMMPESEVVVVSADG